MADGADAHQAVVDAWMAKADGLPAARLVDLFEAGIQRMWQRAQPTLGEVTLGAIVDRVLYTACERFPFLGLVQLRNGSVYFHDLRKGIGPIERNELASATRFVVTEFLTVLGHLTAEILTPALHHELSQVRLTKGHAKPRARKTKT